MDVHNYIEEENIALFYQNIQYVALKQNFLPFLNTKWR